jgi:DNA helicase-2/ATP-dependent DNA helicase PcrA
MNTHNYIDYDDLLMKMVLSIRNNEKFREKIQNRFEYVLVDEFQDTNSLQFEITQTFAMKLMNITIVGDIDQSIYGWRFADYTNIVKFQTIFPTHTKYLMQQNYRSTQNIISCSNSIIEQTSDRLNEKVWSSNETGDKVIVKLTTDQNDEANFVVNQIINLNKNKHVEYNEIAILIRTHFCSRAFEESLSRNKIPYKVVGDYKFYEREEIQDILSYLKFIVNFKDVLSFERIINVPKRGIGNVHTTKISKILVDNGWDILISDKNYKNKLNSFIFVINSCIDMINDKKNALEIVNFIVDQIKYKKYLEDKYEKEKAVDKWNNVDELVNVASRFYTIESLLIDIQLVDETNEKNNANNKVTISSIHSAKGLEWDSVFVTTINDGNIPHYFALTDDKPIQKVDEERRLLYVATSRARKYLTLSYCKKMMSFGKSSMSSVSRFLNNLPTDAITNLSNSEDQKNLIVEKIIKIIKKK